LSRTSTGSSQNGMVVGIRTNAREETRRVVSTHSSVTHNVPLAFPAQNPSCGARDTSTASSDHRSTGGISTNEDGVEDVSEVCSSEVMYDGGAFSGESMVRR
jgi:hypothetical protein